MTEMFPIIISYFLIIIFIIFIVITCRFLLRYLKENQDLKREQNKMLSDITKKLNK